MNRKIQLLNTIIKNHKPVDIINQKKITGSFFTIDKKENVVYYCYNNSSFAIPFELKG